VELVTSQFSHPAAGSAVFPLLVDPASYEPSTIDLLSDAQGRETWLRIFESHLPGLVRLAAQSQDQLPDAASRAAALGEAFARVLREYRRDPCAHGPPSVLRFCTIRQELLDRFGFDDPYRPIKECENTAAMRILPQVLRELDALPPDQRLAAALSNIFAGNLFDMGCAGTIAMYESGQVEFRAAQRRLPPRPWSVDDLDAAATRFSTPPPHRKAVIFVDNAGGDAVLGMLPLAHYLLERGAEVVLTANSRPALNDVTHEELRRLVEQAGEIDPVLQRASGDGRLQLVPSGNGIPLIDLSRVSRELAASAQGADLLVLEGMGRALETNFHARFTVDTLKLAMVKEQHVADTIGARLYEPVCRFEPAPAAR